MYNQNESTLFPQNLSVNCNGFLLDFSTAKIMGIVNLTPDSFYDGGQINSVDKALKQAESMLAEGASILDLGAFSSRPGAAFISEEEEKNRLVPVLRSIRKEFPKALLSIDTYRSEIAEIALSEGAAIINDISGFSLDENLISIVSKYNAPYVLMHMQGNPQNMQKKPVYNDVLKDIYSFLAKKIDLLREKGITDIIIDPGFGFGKSLEHNYTLLANLNFFQHLNYPILVGISRKKMIQNIVNSTAEQSLNGTTAAHVIALLNGANILRVHDVKAAKEAIAIVEAVQKQ